MESETETAQQPLGSVLTALAAAAPAAPAVTCEDLVVTRSALESMANRLARVLRAAGVKEGELVTIALPNGPQFYAACFAAWKLGATPHPVSPRMPIRELTKAIALSRSRAVIGPNQPVSQGCSTIPARFEPGLEVSDAPLAPTVCPEWKAFSSGGSTGEPKIIVSRQRGVLADLLPLAAVLGIEPGARQLVVAPLYHNAAFLWSVLGILQGQHLVVLPRFEPAATLDAIERSGIEITVLVPTMMSRMLRLIEQTGRGYDMSSLRSVWHLAAPCPGWVKRGWIDLVGPNRLWELYAGTEAQAATVISAEEWLRWPGSVGRVIMGEIQILDPRGDRLPPGSIGEIYMRSSPTGAANYRYVGAEAVARGTWETIGDLGWMNEEGYLYLSDRKADMIVCGGINIYPAEVENALSEHRAVESCVIVGLPDEDLGKRVHAIVQLNAAVTQQELTAHLAERLLHCKIPRSWEFVDAPVHNEAGKVRRSQLAERAVERGVSPSEQAKHPR